MGVVAEAVLVGMAHKMPTLELVVQVAVVMAVVELVLFLQQMALLILVVAVADLNNGITEAVLKLVVVADQVLWY